MKRATPLLTLAALVALLIPVHSAYTGHAGDKDIQALLTAYPDLRGKPADSCATCHRSAAIDGVPGSPGRRDVNHCDYCHATFVRGGKPPAVTLSTFGKAYAAAGRGAAAFRAIASADADGDGASNEVELRAGTDPGDPASRPSARVAPQRVLSLADVERLAPPVTTTILLNSTKSRSGDTYSTFRGARLDTLLAAVGLSPSARTVDVLSVDGYETTFTLAELRKAWPQGRPVMGLSRDALGACGWVSYPATGLDAARELPAAPILLAVEENGKALEPAKIEAATGRLVGKGPLRVVVPQFAISPPDLPQTADASCAGRLPPAQRFHEDYDHNASKSAGAVVALRVKPLLEGTRGVDWQSGAEQRLSAGQVIVFGALAERREGQAASASPTREASRASTPGVLRLATTTSTADTGLLKAILPSFEKACACRVDVVAVGTGQALELARRGDADVVLVHARAAEDQFLAEGHARERFDVMHNDFVIVGPAADPAKVGGVALAKDAFAAVARAGAPFVSRGDNSGTEAAEKRVWAAANVSPTRQAWYRSVGQGMGETLIAAQELRAYTIADRGTWLSMRSKLTGLRQLLGGRTIEENRDPGLRNQYGVMAVDAGRHPGVNAAKAQEFVEWLRSAATQRAIGAFGRERFGQSLFYPNPTR